MNNIFVFKQDYAIEKKAKLEYECEKEEVINSLMNYRNLSTTKRIKKYKNKKGSIKYLVLLNNDGVDNYAILNFPIQYQKFNSDYIEGLESWVNNYKKYNLLRLKMAAILCGITITGTALAYEPLKEKIVKPTIEKIVDLLTDEVADLERDIEIHSGHYCDPEGTMVSPYLGHSCCFIDDKSLSVEERISLYCEENDLEYLEEAALKKYDYLFKDQLEEGFSIDLKQLEKEHKKKIKAQNQQ